MEHTAWPRTRAALGKAQTLQDLFDVDGEVLERAIAAASDDLSEHGTTEAYARAKKEGEAISEGDVPFLESRRAFTFALPAGLRLMKMRMHAVEADIGLLGVDYGFREVLTTAVDTYRDLGDSSENGLTTYGVEDSPVGGEDPTQEPPGLEGDLGVDQAEDYFSGAPFTNRLMPTPPVLRLLEMASPLAMCKVADESFWLLLSMCHVAQEGGGSYEVVEDFWNAGGDLGRGYLTSEVAQAWLLSGLADAWRRVENMKFVEDRPPTWELGASAVGALVTSGRNREALRVLEWMDPDDYADEVVATLPDIPDEYQESWGNVEDWNSVVDEWNTNYEGQMIERLLWAGVEKATAHQALGQFEEALKAIPTDERYGWSSADAATRVRWARTLSYLEGRRDGAAQAGHATSPNSDSDLNGKLEFLGKLMMEDRARGVRMERMLEAQGSLLVDIPDATAKQMRQDFVADHLFEKHLDGLRRGWSETAKLEEHERRLMAIKSAIGTTAWTLLEPDSQVEMRAFQTIKETWGREHLAQAAYGLCRAFERELRRALQRVGDYSRDELSGMSWGQLLSAAASRPLDDRLQRVATRVDELGLKNIRDAAMHPTEWAFTSDKLRNLENALLRDGFEKKGLLRHVVTYRRHTDAEE